MLPETATEGQGGISPGLAPGKSRKGRMGLETCTASQAGGRNESRRPDRDCSEGRKHV